MDKDGVCAGLVVVAILLAGFTFMLGLVVGANIMDSEWTSHLEHAKIKLVHHKTVVDGVVTTNWVEVVRLD